MKLKKCEALSKKIVSPIWMSINFFTHSLRTTETRVSYREARTRRPARCNRHTARKEERLTVVMHV